MRKLFCATLVTGLALLSGASQAHASTILATDSSWRVTPTAPGAGWNTSIGFSDAAWQSATVIGAGGFGSQNIWSSGGQFSTTETTIWVRKVFNLAALPLSALLNGGFDDDGEVYVNGTLVWTENNGYANNFFVDILPYLTTGDNLIAYRAYDNFPAWGYNHGSWLQVEGTPVPEPGTLILVGLGAVAIAVRRTRRYLR